MSNVAQIKHLFWIGLFWLFGPTFGESQTDIQWSILNPMPEKVTNNAVTSVEINGQVRVFSFTGIDSTKACGAPHLRAFEYDVTTNQWKRIANVPDTQLSGKIAAGASTIKDKVYVVGGYSVTNTCAEVSGIAMHIYDPLNESYTVAAPLLKAIDDHVQAVWKDSLLFVVTGWSNSSNVPNVQIYHPNTDTWEAGTPLPSGSTWRTFGASGTIIGDTLYMMGGAGNWTGSTFPSVSGLKKGYIHPDNPTQIDWMLTPNTAWKGYRMACTHLQGKALWIGGSNETYNFDGLAYAGNSPVDSQRRIWQYEPSNGGMTDISTDFPASMDFRGIAKLDENTVILAGGMLVNQEVTNQTLQLTIDISSKTEEKIVVQELVLGPNPGDAFVHIQATTSGTLLVRNAKGQIIWQNAIENKTTQLDTSSWPNGAYTFQWQHGRKSATTQWIKL